MLNWISIIVLSYKLRTAVQCFLELPLEYYSTILITHLAPLDIDYEIVLVKVLFVQSLDLDWSHHDYKHFATGTISISLQHKLVYIVQKKSKGCQKPALWLNLIWACFSLLFTFRPLPTTTGRNLAARVTQRSWKQLLSLCHLL